jgi:hypothetical protein
VALRRGGGKSREGPRAGQDYSTLGASSLIDAWRVDDWPRTAFLDSHRQRFRERSRAAAESRALSDHDDV